MEDDRLTPDMVEELKRLIGDLEKELTTPGVTATVHLPRGSFLTARACFMPAPAEKWEAYTLQRGDREALEKMLKELKAIIVTPVDEPIHIQPMAFLPARACSIPAPAKK